MTGRRLLPVILTGSLLLAGCDATSEASLDAEALPQLQDPCLLWQAAFDVVPDRCGEALNVAEARLGWLHWPVASRVLRNNLCPPNARCRATGPDEFNLWVIYRFTSGDPVMIHVHSDTEHAAAALVADSPEPPPDWLLEELATSSGG